MLTLLTGLPRRLTSKTTSYCGSIVTKRHASLNKFTEDEQMIRETGKLKVAVIISVTISFS